MDDAKDFFNYWYLFWKNAAAVIGLVCVSVFAFKQLRLLHGALHAYVMTPFTRKNLKNYGSWAVVTGASDGIGKAYCHELAKQGLNVVLISRSKGKLDAVAEELRSKFSVETKVIVADFTGGKEMYAEMGPQLTGLDIGVLVNNVGMSCGHPDYFTEYPSDDVWNIMVCNTAAVTMMTHIVLPGMLKKNKGVIVNVSSILGRYPGAFYATYSASKAYIDFFSQALAREYDEKSGIIVQAVLPGLVATKMSKMKKQSLFTPSPATYARSAVGTIGTLSRTAGYWPHSFMTWVSDYLIPKRLLYSMTDKIILKARNKAVQRKEKET